jgi:hypothetical protein
MFARLEHAVGDAEMSFVREAGVGCSRFISRRPTKSRAAGRAAACDQIHRLTITETGLRHINWSSAKSYCLWRPINSNNLPAVPLDWS